MREKEDPYALHVHLMPKTGWLNDPNGLCEWNGVYHIFFQYSPLDVTGGSKDWGHYVTKDFCSYTHLPPALFPDTAQDKDGVYSGSALIHDGKMYLFYTGNVKEAGAHDYIFSGRQANTMLVESEDGRSFETKELLMTNVDYPASYTCHVRDPKVYEEDGVYYMVQGGRKKEGKGAVLLFRSEDLHSWKFEKEVTTAEPFGYMWECPDAFWVGEASFLSCSPQGLLPQEYRYQNTYQSGYFRLQTSLLKTEQVCEEGFREWDMGFDFYAPQTFVDEKGRRILIAWAGIPDAAYDNEPTVKYGWQHALTLPRELTLSREQALLQYPVEELKRLRRDKISLEGDRDATNFTALCGGNVFELQLFAGTDASEGADACAVVITDGTESISLTYKNGVLLFQITAGAGCGRTQRKLLLQKMYQLSLFVDTSLIEIYVNRGEAVFTSRFYFKGAARILTVRGMEKTVCYPLTAFRVEEEEEKELL